MSFIRWIKEAYDRTMPFHFIPDCFKTQWICIKVAKKDPWWLKDVPDKFKTQEIHEKAVRSDPKHLRFTPIHFKTEAMCNEPLKKSHGCWKMSLITLKHKKCV